MTPFLTSARHWVSPRISHVHDRPLTPFWLVAWAIAVSIAWLLPNHYPPWLTFHTDAWMAIVMSLAAGAVFLRTSGPVVWHGIAALAAVLVFVPGLQYALGLIASPGTVWISSAYCLGFLVALLTGARWETTSRGQLVDGLCMAIGIAAIVSTGLQLHQWLSLDLLDIWSMGDGYGRPFANFGQPNNLGTFLLWGVLAAAWGLARSRIGIATSILMVAFLLFGVALTLSRTAWISVAILVAASWIWRKSWVNRRLPWLVTGLGLYFVLCVLSIDSLNQVFLLSLPSDSVDLTRMSGELRTVVWPMYTDAALQKPWFGYGWNQVSHAQLAVALDHPPLRVLFSHSHNLFLDLVLWGGIPFGFLVAFIFLRWFWSCVRVARDAKDVVLLLFLFVVGNHAMLELPLHHAYFLLPTGLMMGALNVRLMSKPLFASACWTARVVWFVSIMLLGLIIRDYARVESSYQDLRFEWARIKTEVRGGPPDVLLLTQWQDFIRMARFEPKSNMSSNELDWMRMVTSAYPSAGAFHKLAGALALNDHPAEATLWLKKMCKFVSKSQCNGVKDAWAEQSIQSPLIASVPWPN